MFGLCNQRGRANLLTHWGMSTEAAADGVAPRQRPSPCHGGVQHWTARPQGEGDVTAH